MPRCYALLCRPVVSRCIYKVSKSAALQRPLICLLGTLLGIYAAAASAGEGDAAREYLDEQTGATITIVTHPLVFAHARTELAANVRDYVTLEAAAVDRSGKVSYVLIAYFWSTVDPRLRDEPPPAPEPLLLQADDRRLQLSTRGQTAHEAGIGVAMDAPPGSNAVPRVYTTDLPTLRFIAEARQLSLLVETERTTLSYGLWEDRRPSLRAFVRHLSAQD